jgi:histidyl-tRNA synthetase
MLFLLFILSGLFIQSNCAAAKPKNHLEKVSRCLFLMKPAIAKKPQLRDLVEARVSKVQKHVVLDIENLIEILDITEDYARAHEAFSHALHIQNREVAQQFLALINDKPLVLDTISSQEQGKKYSEFSTQHPNEIRVFKRLNDQSGLAEASVTLARKLFDINENTPGAATILFSVLAKNKIKTCGDLLEHVEPALK